MDVRELPINQIHADDEFNCRGVIAPIDVVDLARDIDINGLQNPLVVHEYNPQRQQQTKYKYRLISGYRRYKAFRVLGRETVPCNVLGPVTDSQAQLMNLSENLHRKDLNILQEARALERLKLAGLGQVDVANQLHQSRGWVQVRYMLLDLPKEIQEEASAGFFNQQQIRNMYSMGTREKQLAAAKSIKERKEKGEKVPATIEKPKSPFLRKHRQRNEIFQMMDHIREAVGCNIGLRCLAWAAGEISDNDLYRDIAKLAEERGINYVKPEAMLSVMS